MSEARKCPHCGGLVESDVPAGWVKVPLELWNKKVQEIQAFRHAGKACGEAKRLEARVKALRAALPIMAEAAADLEKVVTALDEEIAGEPPAPPGEAQP